MARAVRLDEYGGRDVLYLAEVDVAHPGPGEVLVAMRAAGINPGEAAIRQGHLHDRFPATFPSGEGSDLAGVVTEIGEGVESVSAGDEVLGWTDRRASHADYVTVPATQLIAKPVAMAWEVAGGFFVVASTAYAAVRAVGAGRGDTVVVSAAAGGVGSVAVQLARVRGADVIGIASEVNHPWLSAVGVTPVAYGDGLIDRIKAAAPSGVDAFIDTFGPDYVRLAVDLGVAGERIDTVIAYDLARQLGAKSEGSAAATSTAVLAEMADLVVSGRVWVPIAGSFPLTAVSEAYEQLERRHSRGKIVLVP